jgi:hypothetical protein
MRYSRFDHVRRSQMPHQTPNCSDESGVTIIPLVERERADSDPLISELSNDFIPQGHKTRNDSFRLYADAMM